MPYGSLYYPHQSHPDPATRGNIVITSFQTGLTRLSKSSEARAVDQDEIGRRRDTIALDTVEEIDFTKDQEAGKHVGCYNTVSRTKP
jgi:hypothetical protein